MAKITVTEYTDPFCTWCWGSEPILKHLKERYRDQITIEFVMGGLIEDFDDFADPGHNITDPEDVGSHWEEASSHHGMPVSPSVWNSDNPPLSTYPANQAYKAAEQQGKDIAHRYLRRLREAVATEGKNIAQLPVLVQLADEIGLDTKQFRDDYDSAQVKQALNDDLKETRDHDITGFPTFLIEQKDTEILLQGYRGFSWFEDVFDDFDVNLEVHGPRELVSFIKNYDRVTTQEVAEVYGLGNPAARVKLESLADNGQVREEKRGNGSFWTIAES